MASDDGVVQETIVECRIVCRTNYWGDHDIDWHKPVNKPARIVRQATRIGDFELPMSYICFDDKTFPITMMRKGLEGRVIAVGIDDTVPAVLYTDILTPEGKADNSGENFLEEAASGMRQRRRDFYNKHGRHPRAGELV